MKLNNDQILSNQTILNNLQFHLITLQEIIDKATLEQCSAESIKCYADLVSAYAHLINTAI